MIPINCNAELNTWLSSWGTGSGAGIACACGFAINCCQVPQGIIRSPDEMALVPFGAIMLRLVGFCDGWWLSQCCKEEPKARCGILAGGSGRPRQREAPGPPPAPLPLQAKQAHGLQRAGKISPLTLAYLKIKTHAQNRDYLFLQKSGVSHSVLVRLGTVEANVHFFPKVRSIPYQNH